MSSDIGLMVKEYEAWKRSREELGSLDDLAARFGVSRQILLYHVSKKKSPGSDTTEAENDESRDEMTQESRMSPDNTCSSVAPTSGDKAS